MKETMKEISHILVVISHNHFCDCSHDILCPCANDLHHDDYETIISTNHVDPDDQKVHNNFHDHFHIVLHILCI